MKPFDFKQFEKDLIEAARQVIRALEKKKDAQTICGFALYTDESGSSISVAANTTAYLSKMQEDASEDPLYYKWSAAEWKYDSIANKKIDGLSDELSSCSMDLEGKAFEQYVSNLFESCISVLTTLKADNGLAAFDERCIMLFDVSDYEDINNQITWVKQLNVKEEASEFKSWIKSQAG